MPAVAWAAATAWSNPSLSPLLLLLLFGVPEVVGSISVLNANSALHSQQHSKVKPTAVQLKREACDISVKHRGTISSKNDACQTTTAVYSACVLLLVHMLCSANDSGPALKVTHLSAAAAAAACSTGSSSPMYTNTSAATSKSKPAAPPAGRTTAVAMAAAAAGSQGTHKVFAVPTQAQCSTKACIAAAAEPEASWLLRLLQYPIHTPHHPID